MDNLGILLKALLITAVTANLEGPFLFWGPKALKDYRKPALERLEQDDLINIYEKQAAIVVFNNQDSVPLSGENFPRLRRLLERKTLLVLPQDFLDVHPDYINNETQVFTLQGPNSERDAAITETFQRLEDIYGSGRVLGLLGNSVSDDRAPRLRRDAPTPADDEEDTTTTAAPRERPDKVLVEYALYNASTKTTSTSPLQALIYSSKWPVLRFDSGEEVVLKRPLTASVDVKPPKDGKSDRKNRQITKVIVTFLHENSKISLHFRFTIAEGWWVSGAVEVHSAKGGSLLLQPPAGRGAPAAVLGKSYHCDRNVVYSGNNVSLVMFDVQMQPFMEKANRFSDAFDCIGFTTEPIWSGALITIFLNMVMFIALMMIFDIKTNDRYESTKGKSLVITVME